ncbi:hypothetical protein AVEN_271550-1, partial [Araneus ventricosus]
FRSCIVRSPGEWYNFKVCSDDENGYSTTISFDGTDNDKNVRPFQDPQI